MLPELASLLLFLQMQCSLTEPKNLCKNYFFFSFLYLVRWKTSAPDCLHQKYIFLSGQLDQLLSLANIHAERFLTENRFTSSQVHGGQGQVVGVDGSNVDDINIRVWCQVSIVTICFVNIMSGSECFSIFLLPGSNCNNLSELKVLVNILVDEITCIWCIQILQKIPN